ncbi:MAG: hypothetical protein HZB71_06300 [Betaproteobacteria bacterium]|nr:hypothetical protein [Betaproteobacteria bacterium]
MDAASLSQTDTQRLNQLAEKIGRTPAATLSFVLRDGFDECEAKAAAVLQSLAEAKAGQREDTEKVEAQVAALVARHGEKKKAA